MISESRGTGCFLAKTSKLRKRNGTPSGLLRTIFIVRGRFDWLGHGWAAGPLGPGPWCSPAHRVRYGALSSLTCQGFTPPGFGVLQHRAAVCWSLGCRVAVSIVPWNSLRSALNPRPRVLRKQLEDIQTQACKEWSLAIVGSQEIINIG